MHGWAFRLIFNHKKLSSITLTAFQIKHPSEIVWVTLSSWVAGIYLRSIISHMLTFPDQQERPQFFSRMLWDLRLSVYIAVWSANFLRSVIGVECFDVAHESQTVGLIRLCDRYCHILLNLLTGILFGTGHSLIRFRLCWHASEP